MSNAGRMLLAFLTVIAIVVTALSFAMFGQEIALRIGLMSFGFLGLLILTKLVGNKDFLVYVALFTLVGYVVISIASGNFGSRLVGNEMANARYITIDGANFSLRGNEFGTYSNNAFVSNGSLSSTHMTFNGQLFEITGFFESWPIVATGNGQKLTISFTE